jgi:hypothetical protein
MHHMFTDWLSRINRKLKCQKLAGAIAICWAIWMFRNNVTFDKGLVSSYLQHSSGDTLDSVGGLCRSWTEFLKQNCILICFHSEDGIFYLVADQHFVFLIFYKCVIKNNYMHL